MAIQNAGLGALLGFNTTSWISTGKQDKPIPKAFSTGTGFVFFVSLSSHAYDVTSSKSRRGDEANGKMLIKMLKSIGAKCAPWQLEILGGSSGDREVRHVQSNIGPIWLVPIGVETPEDSSHHGILDESLFAAARDRAGNVLQKSRDYDLKYLRIEFDESMCGGLSEKQKKGALVGLELAAYCYKKTQNVQVPGNKVLPKLIIAGADRSLVKAASGLSTGVNLARHLVNSPAAALNPASYADLCKSLFSGSKRMKVTVWNSARLQKEKLNLLHAVGRAAENQACLIHLSYRPTGAKSLKRPIAFVGKGVTFDSGGLDLKPSAPMRLMKKDMGGSASLVGLAWWLEASHSDVACDIYLAVAENSVDSRAMRPGDILHSRIGKSIEIHNTDAEGRLVLADGLVVAASKTGKEKPLAIIDLATLTGAMRVALGAKVAGLCSNDDLLADALLAAGQRSGDPCWRIPLVRSYKNLLKSNVADMTNAASGGLGGGITAALFLEEFVGDSRWAHLDLMAWQDKPSGAMVEVGGNGQLVQALADFLENISEVTLP